VKSNRIAGAEQFLVISAQARLKAISSDSGQEGYESFVRAWVSLFDQQERSDENGRPGLHAALPRLSCNVFETSAPQSTKEALKPRTSFLKQTQVFAK
jgi:hypothetical protein